jgi:hypothetical protein
MKFPARRRHAKDFARAAREKMRDITQGEHSAQQKESPNCTASVQITALTPPT